MRKKRRKPLSYLPCCGERLQVCVAASQRAKRGDIIASGWSDEERLLPADIVQERLVPSNRNCRSHHRLHRPELSIDLCHFVAHQDSEHVVGGADVTQARRRPLFLLFQKLVHFRAAGKTACSDPDWRRRLSATFQR
jgi:hypothetical protein